MKRTIILVTIALIAGLLASCSGTISMDELARQQAFDFTNRAYEDHWMKDWDRVVELATSAVNADPDYALAYTMRGAAFNMLGEPEFAIMDLDMALMLEPSSLAAYINRGVSYQMLSRPNKAREDFRRALELDPESITARLRLTELTGEAGETAESGDMGTIELSSVSGMPLR